MHFRNKSIADSVVERIAGIADSVRNNTPPPAARGSASVNLERQSDGGLLVTKTFSNGETELLTINSQTAIPEGFTDITPQDAAQQASVGADSAGIVEAAALGGDSLDTLLEG